jgi:hypothetical protein
MLKMRIISKNIRYGEREQTDKDKTMEGRYGFQGDSPPQAWRIYPIYARCSFVLII